MCVFMYVRQLNKPSAAEQYNREGGGGVENGPMMERDRVTEINEHTIKILAKVYTLYVHTHTHAHSAWSNTSLDVT